MKLILLLSSFMLSCAFADFEVTLMLPDGKLAKSTKRSLISENTIENNKKGVPKLLQLTTSPQGVFEIPDTFFRKDTDQKSRSLIEAFLIDVPGMPSFITFLRSSSVGLPLAALASRYSSVRRSRGRGNWWRAARPLPSPLAPWQAVQ